MESKPREGPFNLKLRGACTKDGLGRGSKISRGGGAWRGQDAKGTLNVKKRWGEKLGKPVPNWQRTRGICGSMTFTERSSNAGRILKECFTKKMSKGKKKVLVW